MSRYCLVRISGFVAALLVLSTQPTHAGPEQYRKGDSWFGVGMLVEVQYRYNDPEGGPNTDLVFFRRLRPTFEGGLNKDWQGAVYQLMWVRGALRRGLLFVSMVQS